MPHYKKKARYLDTSAVWLLFLLAQVFKLPVPAIVSNPTLIAFYPTAFLFCSNVKAAKD